MIRKQTLSAHLAWCVRVAITVTATATAAMTHAAAPSEAQWDAFNKATLERHVIPRYAALTSAANGLSTHAASYCAIAATAPEKQTAKAALEQAYKNTQQAWQGIKHINFGPIENNMYNFSMQYWPDKKNLTSKHLNALLAAQDQTTLTPEYFRGASITVKGLPALERLIFSDQMDDAFACQLATAISANIEHMASDIHQGWLTFGKARFANALSGDDYYESAQEAATDLLKSLVEPIEFIRDRKLLSAMNSSVDKPKPRLLESWRSRQALDNIKSNLSALDNLYDNPLANSAAPSVRTLLVESDIDGAEALSVKITQGLANAQSLLADTEAPLFETLGTPSNYNKLTLLAAQLKTLKADFSQAMAILNIQLGFNSSDGD